jgi:hypothetical protein
MITIDYPMHACSLKFFAESQIQRITEWKKTDLHVSILQAHRMWFKIDQTLYSLTQWRLTRVVLTSEPPPPAATTATEAVIGQLHCCRSVFLPAANHMASVFTSAAAWCCCCCCCCYILFAHHKGMNRETAIYVDKGRIQINIFWTA